MMLFTKPLYILFFILLAVAPAMASTPGELPPAVRVVLSKAHDHMADDDYDRALEVIENFQARGKPDPDPDRPDPRGYHHPEVYFTIGNIHLATENPEKAGAAYRLALKHDPDHVHARLNLARVQYEKAEYAPAGENFLNAYESGDEKEPEYLYYAAVSWLMADALDASIEAFERLIDKHPDHITPEWRENMVHALLSNDQPGEALSHIKILADEYTGEKRIQWQENLLYLYIRMDMTEAAENYAHTLTREAPMTARWWKALAHAALARDNHKNALVAMTIYAYLTPLTPDEKKLLADLNLHVGIPVMAAPAYEAALNEKDEKSILRNLVIAYQQLEKPKKALEAIAAFGEHENDPELLMLKADILYAMENFTAAAEAYRKAAEIESGHAQTGRAWLMAGYAAWQLNDLPTARDAFKKAAAFDDQKKDATTAIEQLRDLD